MSMETWKEEYYPVEAKDVPEVNAIAASLLKWRGARLAHLERHGIEKLPGIVVIGEGTKGNRFHFDCDSCPLCVHHYLSGPCADCPLIAVYAGKGRPCSGAGSPYLRWRDDNDPEPMIALLEAALAAQTDKGKPPMQKLRIEGCVVDKCVVLRVVEFPEELRGNVDFTPEGVRIISSASPEITPPTADGDPLRLYVWGALRDADQDVASAGFAHGYEANHAWEKIKAAVRAFNEQRTQTAPDSTPKPLSLPMESVE